MKRIFLAAIMIMAASCSGEVQPKLEPWSEGCLDIHQIATGRGNCAFIVMPDGTTMVFDAGDLGDTTCFSQKILPAFPNGSRRPAEWQADYIRHFSPVGSTIDVIDYLCISHFDKDHIGIPYEAAPVAPEGYCMTGVTHLGNLMSIGKIVDRGYPEYDFPYKGVLDSTRGDIYHNYLDFVNARGVNVEGFDVGSRTQFKQLHSPREDFSITCVYASGRYWDGSKVCRIPVPADSLAMFDENRCSCTIKIEYGDFDYHISGDICSLWKEGDPEWMDVERYVADAIGETDAMLANHHAYSGTNSTYFLSKVTPQVMVVPSWDFYHPQPEQLHNMLDSSLFSGPHLVFTTGLVDTNLERLGSEGLEVAGSGHVLIRVYPGGDTFQVFVLDPTEASFNQLLYTSEVLQSR